MKRGSKYGNRRTEVDGISFASAKEARRWSELRLLERAGQISGLERQVRYRMEVRGVPVTTYVADFRYEREGGYVVEDAKGFATDVYKLKKKLMRAVFDIEIQET